jgi:hypothetical protein
MAPTTRVRRSAHLYLSRLCRLPAPSSLRASLLPSMPSLSMAAAWLVALLHRKSRLMTDDDFLAVYGLQPSFLKASSIDQVPAADQSFLVAFIVAAEAKAEGDERTAFIVGGRKKKGAAVDNAHNRGRKAYNEWFRRQKLTAKIHSLMNDILFENDAHPQNLIQNLTADEEDELDDNGMPSVVSIHSQIEVPAATAVFGANVMTSAMISPAIQASMGALIHHFWEKCRKARRRAYTQMETRKNRWLEARAGRFFFC